MVIDTSAIIAIMADEAAAPALVDRVKAATTLEMSMASYVEAATVLWARDISPEALDILLRELGVILVPVDEVQGREAIRARIAYGKGSGHPAQLNFGDTFTYALAKTRSASLLFVGGDFSQTDLIDARA